MGHLCQETCFGLICIFGFILSLLYLVILAVYNGHVTHPAHKPYNEYQHDGKHADDIYLKISLFIKLCILMDQIGHGFKHFFSRTVQHLYHKAVISGIY